MFKSVAILGLFLVASASCSFIREIKVKTASCNECGMTFLGELSVKVCGQGSPPGICCVAVNLNNQETNFIEGKEDIFSGVEIRECYNFNLGSISRPEDFGLTLYHALSDGGQFDYVEVLTSDNQRLRCDFFRFLDGSDWENGSNCRIL